MGSLFRSEEMARCQLFLQNDIAYTCLSELGELSLVQFIDLNPKMNAFQRKFVSEVRRCEEMERKLKYLEKEIKKHGIHMAEVKGNPRAPEPKEMADIESTLEKIVDQLHEINQNSEAMKKNYLEMIELKHVLQKGKEFFDDQDKNFKESEESDGALLSVDTYAKHTHSRMPLGFVTGVILRERIPAFERMLWRACRGNAFLRQAEIEVPVEDISSGHEVLKTVFVVFFQGDQLKIRVKKICEGFHATLYTCPEALTERNLMAVGVMIRLEDLYKVLNETKDHRNRVLVATARDIKAWSMKVHKIKSIYFTLNMFNVDVTRKCLIGECWVPVRDIETVNEGLWRGMKQSGSSVFPVLNQIDTCEVPPTFNRTNKFTNAFQILINAYGVANYREVNPTPYTIITFPFLFAVMFGDLGHGIIMALFGLVMVLFEERLSKKNSKNEIWNILFGGRYVIMLMGIFSMYTGFIYNDIFSKSINIFGSRWTVGYKAQDLMDNGHLEMDPAVLYEGFPYPVGIDPAWNFADNKIRFLNAYKMKISIIIGVFHMMFGVCLSVFNYTFFKEKSYIFALFLPQIIFLLFLFLYLVVLIFIKWVLYGPTNPVETGTSCAPSILITFINMVLFKSTPEDAPCSAWMFPGQQHVQLFLVIAAFLCIPWMLLAKPILMMRDLKKNRHKSTSIENKDEDAGTSLSSHNGGGEGESTSTMIEATEATKQSAPRSEEHESMTEVWIYQGIHTIEYVLGSISHTASYLRLWALSLAHSQLSEVLWGMVMRKGLVVNSLFGGVVLYGVFAFWAVLTISILVLMEGLSAFLHTLRLHWVEFQSKFYTGAGYLFIPFSFMIDQTTHPDE